MSRIGNVQYRVRFEHNMQPKYITLTDKYGNKYKVLNKEQSTTTCHLDEFGETKPTYTATVRLFPGNCERYEDTYCKETGRKKALIKVLANLEIHDRTLIWESYFNRKGVSPKAIEEKWLKYSEF